MQLVTAAQEIIGLLSSRPSEEFYVNELIRLTGRYPNSVEQALKKLRKEKLIQERKASNRAFFHIHPKATPLVIGQIPQAITFDWVKLLNRETAFAFNYYACKANNSTVRKMYGITVSNFWYNGVTHGVYYLQKDLSQLGQSISEKLQKNRSFAKKDVSLCLSRCRRLVNYCKKIPSFNLATKTDHELAAVWSKFIPLFENIFPFLISPHVIESYFESAIRKAVKDPKAASILLSPISLQDDEQQSALKIAAHVKTRGFDGQFEKLLYRHWQGFCWLSMMSLNANPLSLGYFREEIKNILDKIADPQREVLRLVKEEKKRKLLLEKTLEENDISQLVRDQVSLLQKYIYLRTYRRNVFCLGHFYHLPLLHETARRLGLTDGDVKFLLYEEMVAGLKRKITPASLKKTVAERKEGWAFLLWQGNVSIITGLKKIVQTMEQYRIVPQTQLSEKVIRGQPACRGQAVGRAKIIHKLSELNKIESGDILVAQMTTPDYMVAIGKCAGIITDEGGVTCHAAIVSREFNVPCLIATHVATKTLHDNDVIELNATQGFARIIQKSATDSHIKKIAGKPVYPGKVSGKAVIVNDASDFPKVTAGQILITSQATPDFLSCLYRVKGLVVDEDSLTSHAVLYANALKIPTIVGTQNAREIIFDDEPLMLDATHGVLKRHS